MSPESYSWEIREAAEELYIIDGLTFDQVAERTGVSASQLKRWGLESTPTWTERRREYRQAQTSVRRGVMMAKAKLIESVIESEDPMKAFAFGAIVKSSATIDKEARERSQGVQHPAEKNVIEGPGQPVDMAEALGQAIKAKVGMLLAQPGAINLAAIKELQQALEILEKVKGKGASTNTGEGKRISVEEAQAVIDKIYNG